jgi:peptide/nickel transport system permease protein
MIASAPAVALRGERAARRSTRSGWVLARGRLLRDRWACAALAFLVVLVLLAITAPLLPMADPLDQDLAGRLLPPAWTANGSWAHPLGADQLGRDILSRVIWGARVSLVVGVSAVAISGVLGVLAGVLAGYFGGWVDNILMRIADGQLAIPFILLVIAVISVVGPGIEKVVPVLGITGWVVYARVGRAEVLSLREREFVLAARAAGAGPVHILSRHIRPNILGSVAVVASVEVANVILLESSLGFLGLGVQPPTPSWGNMLGEGRDYLTTAWWLATLPGLALATTALSITILGDFLRDFFDPRSSPR